MQTVTREKLVKDLRDVLEDVEQLSRQAAAAGGEQAAELRRKAASALEEAQERVERLSHDVGRAAKDAADATDDWVQEHPWSSIGIAAGLGVLIGVLAARR
jgi:ElaB/YqjD/DUF883 family membrane-anchored ribosome-binding protein